MHEFQDKGPIIFASLDEYNKIVNFVYTDGKVGCFDLEKNEAVFEGENIKKN